MCKILFIYCFHNLLSYSTPLQSRELFFFPFCFRLNCTPPFPTVPPLLPFVSCVLPSSPPTSPSLSRHLRASSLGLTKWQRCTSRRPLMYLTHLRLGKLYCDYKQLLLCNPPSFAVNLSVHIQQYKQYHPHMQQEQLEQEQWQQHTADISAAAVEMQCEDQYEKQDSGVWQPRLTRQCMGDTRQCKGDTRQCKGDTRQCKGDTRQCKGDTRSATSAIIIHFD